MSKVSGTIRQIWRYPVKSTRGEQLESCMVGDKGLCGDRGWAIRDDKVGEVRGGRYLPRLLYLSSRYDTEPENEPWPTAIIQFPDGSEMASDDPKANERLSEWMQQPVSIWPIQPPENAEHYRRLPMTEESLMEEFGREPGEPLPDLSQVPPIFLKHVSIPGTYFDFTPLQLLTTASLAYMKKLNPGADWAVPRFRPNILVDTGDAPGLVEASWVGRRVKLGEVELECVHPTPRCAIPMRAQSDEIQQDPSILRTIVREADQNLGVYCTVKVPGRLFVGDSISVS